MEVIVFRNLKERDFLREENWFCLEVWEGRINGF